VTTPTTAQIIKYVFLSGFYNMGVACGPGCTLILHKP